MATAGKRFKAEQIINLLREIDVRTANGQDRSRGLLTDGYQRTDPRDELLIGEIF